MVDECIPVMLLEESKRMDMSIVIVFTCYFLRRTLSCACNSLGLGFMNEMPRKSLYGRANSSTVRFHSSRVDCRWEIAVEWEDKSWRSAEFECCREFALLTSL